MYLPWARIKVMQDITKQLTKEFEMDLGVFYIRKGVMCMVKLKYESCHILVLL